MKNIFFLIALCTLFALPQNSYSAVAVTPKKKVEYKEMTKAEKKAFRKELRQKIRTTKKAAKKSDAPKLDFDSYRTMGITLAAVGGAGIILGAILELGLIYWLGGLFLTAGVVILILYWLEVI